MDSLIVASGFRICRDHYSAQDSSCRATAERLRH